MTAWVLFSDKAPPALSDVIGASRKGRRVEVFYTGQFPGESADDYFAWAYLPTYPHGLEPEPPK